MIMWAAFSLSFAFVAFFPGPNSGGVLKTSCSSVELPLCKDVLLNTTYTTALTENEQDSLKLEHYSALINIGCSKFARLFICISHLPFCSRRHRELEALRPCRSICIHVYQSCCQYFLLANLAWSQHLNCSLFPRFPSLCIKPSFSPSVSPSPPHSFNLSTTTPSPSTPCTQSLTTPSLTKPSPHKSEPTTAQDIDSRFIFFAVNFLPDLFYSMAFVLGFVCFSITFPLSLVLFYFCWLRFRRTVEQAGGARPDNIPLRDILGMLPPVPEKQRHFLFHSTLLVFSFHASLILTFFEDSKLKETIVF